MNVKTLFIGTSWESLEILKTVHSDSRFNVVGIVTQPDKPVGRKQVLTPSEVKVYGQENSISVYEVSKEKRSYEEALDMFKPELIICIAFGEIMPEFFLEYPKYGSINIHFSLLPKYRGAVPIQTAILNGDTETGVTVMKMSAGMDKGDILTMFKTKIHPNDTNQSLRKRLIEISKENLQNILEKWVNGEIKSVKQDDSEATYCYEKDIRKEKMEINFEEMEASLIDRMVRASIPWPVAWTTIDGRRIKIYEVRVLEEFDSLKPGEMFNDRLRMVYGTKEGQVEILQLQPEGKNTMSAIEFMSGKR